MRIDYNSPVLASMVWVPYNLLGSRQGYAITDELMIQPRGYEGEKPDPITMYLKHPTRPMLGLPWYYGLNWLRRNHPSATLQDVTVKGFPIKVRKLPDPFHEKASPNQDSFFRDMFAAAVGMKVFLAEAPTRTGKTPTALYVIGKLLRTALVIVPAIHIAEQWIEECQNHLGLKRDEIGLLKGGKLKFEGKSIVLAVIHNLVEKKWTKEFYQYFGIVAWDEAHRVGAREFSKSTQQFPARVRMALTATPERKDGCEPLFLNVFGPPFVVAQMKALPCECRVINYKRVGKKLDRTIPRSILLNIITKNKSRNRMLAERITKSYVQGRQGILVLSDRTEQLQILAALCFDMGVAEQDLGLYVRGYTEEDGRKIVVKQTDLDMTKQNSIIIFATYGMMQEAVDIPRLDCGIDASPRASGTQAIGRIRTPLPGKMTPVWFTIRDLGVSLLLRMTDARLEDYRKSGVKIIEPKVVYGATQINKK